MFSMNFIKAQSFYNERTSDSLNVLMWGGGGGGERRCQNAQKHFIIKTY